jgi:hypothetical protein
VLDKIDFYFTNVEILCIMSIIHKISNIGGTSGESILWDILRFIPTKHSVFKAFKAPEKLLEIKEKIRKKSEKIIFKFFYSNKIPSSENPVWQAIMKNNEIKVCHKLLKRRILSRTYDNLEEVINTAMVITRKKQNLRSMIGYPIFSKKNLRKIISKATPFHIKHIRLMHPGYDFVYYEKNLSINK